MSSTNTSIWLRSAAFDLTFVMGGAPLTLALPIIVSLVPAALPTIFWLWIVLFEGSHFWATLSRTYFDNAFREKNARYLNGSLLFFVFPAVAVALRWSLRSNWPTDLYGYFIFLWSLYHNARQHFGFLMIYGKKSGNSASILKGYRTVIYLAIVGAQVYFATHFKTELAVPVAPFRLWPTWLQTLLTYVPYAVSMGASVLLSVLTARAFTANRWRALVPSLYTLVCLVFYSVMFYGVAPREPFFANPANGAQKLMLLAVMNSLFHNIQYHAIVWHYSAARYRSDERFGWAQQFNRSTGRYGTVALAMGLLFAAIVWHMHDWPSLAGTFISVSEFAAIPYVLFFGIIGHHFYLDQRIWRPSTQHELRTYLGLQTTVAHSIPSTPMSQT